MLEKHEDSVTFGGKNFSNLRYADYIDGLTGSLLEQLRLISKLDHNVKKHGIEINETRLI